MSLETLSAARAEAVWEALAQHVIPGRRRELPIEQSLGAVVADDIRVRHDYPPFDRAVMDGYAVRAADVAAGNTRLSLAGATAAGSRKAESLAPQQCLRINTGAPIPGGADAVVPVEDTHEQDGHVEFHRPARPAENIERCGVLKRKDDLLIRAGTRIQAGTLAALVAAGHTHISVYVRPQVAILCTGDELVPKGQRLDFGQIHDSNSTILEALVRRSGGEVVILGRCPDNVASLRASLELGFANEMLCVSGGMSKGTHDLVPRLLGELGVRWLADGLDLKPGRPARIGRSPQGGWVLGLPGNPVSCAICFVLFGSLILDGLQGLPVRPPPMLRGRLDAALPANGARPMFHPAEWSADDEGSPRLRPVEWRGSGDPFGLATANALIYRPDHAPAAAAGDPVRFLPLDRLR